MKNGYEQKRTALIFGILFMIGGFICLYTGKFDYHGKDDGVLFEKNVISDVVSVWIEEGEKIYESVGECNVKTEYCTNEIARINGKTITINGRYDELPGKYIEHTLVSYDGKNYEVKDKVKRNTLINFIAGTSFILIGIALMAFGPRLNI
jgi:hypothetical protein